MANPTGINQYTKGGKPKAKMSYGEKMSRKLRAGKLKSGPRNQSPIKYTRGL